MKKLITKKMVSVLMVIVFMVSVFSVNIFASGCVGDVYVSQATLSGDVTLNGGSATGFTTVNSSVAFPFNMTTYYVAGTYQVSLEYLNNSGTTKTLTIYVNGQKVKQTFLKSSPTMDCKPEWLYLNSGMNTITYKYESGSSASISVNRMGLQMPMFHDYCISQGKSASASSQESWNPVANGNDGNTSTRWCAINGDLNQWYEIDLNGNYRVDGTEVNWEAAGKVYGYKVEGSVDRNTWTTILDATSNLSTSQVQKEIFYWSQPARYVRITVTGLETNWWASFYEFKVFGST